MTVDVTSLDRRSPASLRAIVGAQRLRVTRRPDSVAPAQPSDDSYWRFLLRRTSLEGRCAWYQTYDARGDENDWNINIAPDPAYRWLLDPGILHALSLSSGAPDPIDLCEVKSFDGVQVIECELTPDDAMYDTFTAAGLPITSGGSWPDGAEQEGLGPTGSRVGVYGAFVGDYGHGGRPEIHPFDAFWRRFHEPRSSSISWDLGVFQDDSNRFNADWSKAPIDIEFRVPFCVDIPVTLRSTVTSSVRFRLQRSAFCSVVGKNTRGGGTASLTETFLAPTVRFRPQLRNRLEVTVQDLTGLSGRPFALSFGDLTYTTSRRFGLLTVQAWLAGTIIIRVAVNQDGFVYWNLSGPNSATAADAPSDGGIVSEPGDVIDRLSAARGERSLPVRVTVTEARPVISTGEAPELTAEVVVDRAQGAGQRVVVRPREEALLVDDARQGVIELESFDLFATASGGELADTVQLTEVDITSAISRLAGLDGSHHLRPTTASIEVADAVVIELASRYAPYRNGKVAGEERSTLSEALTRAHPTPVDIRVDVRIAGADGSSRRRRVTKVPDTRAVNPPDVRLEEHGNGHRLVIGPLESEPTTIRVEATMVDRFGLRSTTSASVQNFRVMEARAWVERAAGISLAQMRRHHDALERAARTAPTVELESSVAMFGAVVDTLASLDRPQAVPAGRVAGAVRLAQRVAELVPARYLAGKP